jgi:hypothetical protein
MSKFKKVLKIIVGVLLMPIMFSVFIADRLVVVPLLWLKTDTLLNWLRNNSAMVESFIRVGFALVICLLLNWIF